MDTTTAPLTSQKLHRVLKAAGLSKSESGASGASRT